VKESGKIYFASDFHLGLPAGSSPLEREKKVVSWLNSVVHDAREIYLLGDIFDFWWEYKLVVPRGFTRFLGTLSKITDSGIPVHFFTGNHDMWAIISPMSVASSFTNLLSQLHTTGRNFTWHMAKVWDPEAKDISYFFQYSGTRHSRQCIRHFTLQLA
jgi:hypothetical protein